MRNNLPAIIPDKKIEISLVHSTSDQKAKEAILMPLYLLSLLSLYNYTDEKGRNIIRNKLEEKLGKYHKYEIFDYATYIKEPTENGGKGNEQ